MFLGFVGGGRRGQESWVALELTVCSVAAAAVGVAGGIAASSWAAVSDRGALLLCCLPPPFTGAVPLLLLPCLLGKNLLLSSYL